MGSAGKLLTSTWGCKERIIFLFKKNASLLTQFLSNTDTTVKHDKKLFSDFTNIKQFAFRDFISSRNRNISLTAIAIYFF